MCGINKKKTLLVRYECSHICIRSLRKKVTSKKKKRNKKISEYSPISSTLETDIEAWYNFNSGYVIKVSIIKN